MAIRVKGTLTLATSRIGMRVRCVSLPDISFWTERFYLQAFDVPEVGKIYIVRSNVFSSLHRGVLLKEIQNAQVSLFMASGEPIFEFSSFSPL